MKISGNTETKIEIAITLTGDCLDAQDYTLPPTALDRYEEMLREACEAQWPGAEVDIDQQPQVSGLTQLPRIWIDGTDAEDDARLQPQADLLRDTIGRVWQAWHEEQG